MEKAEVTILLPVYNEVEIIETVISEFYEEIGKKITLDIIVSEDGSTDGTKEVLRKLSLKIPMKLILENERKGYSKGLIDGLNEVNTDFVIFMDSDGQHLARDFWGLFENRYMYDIVSGWRVERADSFFRKLMSAVFKNMAKFLFGLPDFHDITGPYKLIKTRIAKEVSKDFKYMRESFWTEFTIRAYKKGYSIHEVSVTHRERLGGSTRVYKLSKLPSIVASQFLGMFKLWLDLR